MIKWIKNIFRKLMKSDGDVKEGETSMASDQIDRKSKIVNHVNSLEVSINAVKESKECVKEDIEAGKTVLEYLDRAEYEMNKDLNLYKVLNIDRVDELDATIWNNYETQYVKNQNLCASICGYRDNLKQRDPTLSTALSGSFATNASSTSPTAYVLFNNTPVETEQFKSTAAHHKIDKHPVRLIDFIYSELAEIDKDKADLFQKLVREFRASGPDVQYTRLMDIRSLIFDHIFETLCPESDCSKTDWFQNAASGTIERRKRYWQPKYFILGSTAFLSLASLLRNRVDTVCQDMFDLFNKLSDYGKHGIDDRQTQFYFNETIATFSESLQLRDSLYS